MELKINTSFGDGKRIEGQESRMLFDLIGTLVDRQKVPLSNHISVLECSVKGDQFNTDVSIRMRLTNGQYIQKKLEFRMGRTHPSTVVFIKELEKDIKACIG